MDRRQKRSSICHVKADFELLEQETDAKGRHFTIHKLPIPAVRQVVTEEDLPGYIYEEGEEERYAGERLAASYVNFLYRQQGCPCSPV